MEIPENEWHALVSAVLEIKEAVEKLADEASKELLSPAEVCAMLKVSRNTYQNYVRAGLFRQVRTGAGRNARAYVRRSEITRLIGEGKV
jgi:hypothetical protein